MNACTHMGGAVIQRGAALKPAVMPFVGRCSHRFDEGFD